MLIQGRWLPCSDGISRPVIPVDILAAEGHWFNAPLLVDSGADRTVFSAAVARSLIRPTQGSSFTIAGIGGLAEAGLVQTTIRFIDGNDRPVVLRGTFACSADLEHLDISVLGRDVLNLFAVIVDWPGKEVVLVGQRHEYRIIQR